MDWKTKVIDLIDAIDDQWLLEYLYWYIVYTKEKQKTTSSDSEK